MCLPIAERIQTPMAWQKQLCTRQCEVPAVGTASSKGKSRRETGPRPAPCGGWGETPLTPAVRQEIPKRDRRAPQQAWSCPFLQQQVTRKPPRAHSAQPVALEAAGTHIVRRVRLHSQPPQNSRRGVVPAGRSRFVVPTGVSFALSFRLVIFYF